MPPGAGHREPVLASWLGWAVADRLSPGGHLADGGGHRQGGRVCLPLERGAQVGVLVPPGGSYGLGLVDGEATRRGRVQGGCPGFPRRGGGHLVLAAGRAARPDSEMSSLRIALSLTGTPTLALALTSSSIASWCGSSCTVTLLSWPSTR